MAINRRWKRSLGRRARRRADLSQGSVEQFGLYCKFSRGLKVQINGFRLFIIMIITGPPGMQAVFNLFMLSAFYLRDYGH